MRRCLDSRLLVALAGAVATALLTACGGGGTSAESLTQFRSQANQVCKDSQQQFDKIQQTQPRTASQTEKQASALADVSQQALDNLHQIAPPQQLKDLYDRYLTAREKDLGFIKDGADAAHNNDINAYLRATRNAAAQAPLRRQLALQLGLRFCSRPSVSFGK